MKGNRGIISNHKRIMRAAMAGLMAVVFLSDGVRPLTLVLAEEESTPPVSKREKNRRSRTTKDDTEAAADRRKVLLTTGEDKIIDMDFDVNPDKQFVSIGNPQVVGYQVINVAGQRRQLVLKPLKAGETTMSIRDDEGTIQLILTVVVTGSNLLRRAGEIRELLRDIEGIDVKVVGQKVVVDGEVLVPADYARMLSVITDKSYSDLVMNLTTLSPFAMQVLSKRIMEDINSFAPNVKTRVVNGMIFLEGTVDNIDQAKRAGEVAKLYLPEVKPGNMLQSKDPTAQTIGDRKLVVNFIVVNPPPPKKQEKLVRITVHFVELAKDYNKVFGFKWQPGFTSDPQISLGQAPDGTNGASGASFTATISSLFPKLQSAQNAGYARVLKTGTFITRSGQAGELEDTTKYTYTMFGANGQPAPGAEEVGLRVAVTPQILGQSEDIQMDLQLSQKNVVGRVIAGQAPTVAMHKVRTNVYVKNAESAAVAGVQSSEVLTNFNKDDPKPGSFEEGTDPLFTLMRSKQYGKRKGQFVIFVTPQIVENASDGTEDLKKNFRVKAK